MPPNSHSVTRASGYLDSAIASRAVCVRRAKAIAFGSKASPSTFAAVIGPLSIDINLTGVGPESVPSGATT